MSATIAREGGRVQLAQSDMHLPMNMAEIAVGGFLPTAIAEMQHLMKKPCARVRAEKKWEVEFPRHREVNAPMESHPAMVHENQTDVRLPYHNGTAKHLQTPWRGNGMGAPPPEPATPSQWRAPAPAADTEGAHSYEIGGVPPGYVYIHTPLPRSQLFDLDAYSKDRKHVKDFIPDLLTEEGTSTG